MNWVTALGPLLIAVGGFAGLAAILLVPAQIRKLRGDTTLSEADAAAKLSAASVAILEPAQRELARMTAQLVVAEQKIDALTGQVSALRDEVHGLRRENERLRVG